MLRYEAALLSTKSRGFRELKFSSRALEVSLIIFNLVLKYLTYVFSFVLMKSLKEVSVFSSFRLIVPSSYLLQGPYLHLDTKKNIPTYTILT